MSFLTQGKTNWKFLAIIAVLAVIVGGGILWCQRTSEQFYQSPEKTIIEDKSANWKIFAHPYYQFQIRVPLDWGAGHFTSFFPFEYPIAGEVRSVPFCPPDMTGTIYCEDCCDLIRSAPGVPPMNSNPILLFICDASGSLCETEKELEDQYYKAFTGPDLEDAVKRITLQLNREMSESWGRTPKMELILFDATYEEVFDDMVASFDNFYSGWQVYRSNGYEFKYPPHYKHHKAGSVEMIKGPNDLTIFYGISEGGLIYVGETIIKAEELSLADYLNYYYRNTGYENSHSGAYQNPKYKEIINTDYFVRVDSENKDIEIWRQGLTRNLEGFESEAYLMDKNRGSTIAHFNWSIISYEYDEKLGKDLLGDFDQILATFKFLSTTGLECGECPQIIPPHPDFCKDGTIISPQQDKCGCWGPPGCENSE